MTIAKMHCFLIASVLATVGWAQQPNALFWGGIRPGPYTVGYKSYFVLDYGRRYGADRGPRPVLVALWYPGEGTTARALQYRQYLTSPLLARYPRFGPTLEAFLLDTVSDDLFRKRRADLNPNESAFLEGMLSKPVLAGSDATPAKGPFPALLYHSGAAGSFEDNSVLCEYLASYGYVVMTSAFPSSDGQHVSNNYGGPKTSWDDLGFLLAHALKLGFVDPLKVGAFGHSIGAQYLVEWLGQRRTPLRALVMLDSTLEYTADDDAAHRSLRKRLSLLRPSRLPVLAAASADASPNFSTWNRYLPCRADASIRYFRHNDYLLHGSLARTYSGEQMTDVRRNYDRLTQTVRAFFDAHLRGTPADWRQLLSESNDEFRVVDHTFLPANPDR